jgi:3-oxoacyl-[acyl-carrier protein] reductase
MKAGPRRAALVTGVGREAGLGAAIAVALASNGWDIATTWWPALDRETYGTQIDAEPRAIRSRLEDLGAKSVIVEADMGDESAPRYVFDEAENALGPLSALIVNHTHCVVAGLLDTSVESLDRHLAVNVRGAFLLIREFARRYRPDAGPGRIITLTSDHTAGNVAYGVSKGAADRLTLAAAYELGHLGITANAVNPGPTDTGWMNDDHRAHARAQTPLPRAGTAQDAANLVAFVCSEAGSWITGQLLYSNGGFRGTIG